MEVDVLVPYFGSGNGARKCCCVLLSHTSLLNEHIYKTGAFPM